MVVQLPQGGRRILTAAAKDSAAAAAARLSLSGGRARGCVVQLSCSVALRERLSIVEELEAELELPLPFVA